MGITCRVINLTTSNQVTFKMVYTPRVGDTLPINYLNEKVKEVIIATPLLIKHLQSMEDFDLLVYTD